MSLKGDTGSQGAGGFSAYQIALNNGFSGTEQQWIDSLKGQDGQDGQDGSIDLLTFNIDENMHLIMQLETNTNLNFTLDENGHLILIN